MLTKANNMGMDGKNGQGSRPSQRSEDGLYITVTSKHYSSTRRTKLLLGRPPHLSGLQDTVLETLGSGVKIALCSESD